MSKTLGLVAFLAGLGVVGWIATGYFGGHTLALTMTVLIGAFYLMGAWELRRFQQVTSHFREALTRLGDGTPQLGEWLATVPAPLRNSVRLRIEGERVGLPGPALTPYLVGLLVLLGMLGTFLGMVVTLNGAVLALESTTDLATIRTALSAPIKGLGLAFGTSVAGVAASAMLGLMSVLARRDRLEVALTLDARIATTLRGFSRAHQREQTLEHLQLQARTVPALVDSMQMFMAQLALQHDGLNQRLMTGQEHFYRHAQTAFTELAASVDLSLKEGFSESARLASATMEPAVHAAMAGIVRETAVFQTSMSDAVAQQLQGLTSRFEGAVTQVSDGWRAALDQQSRSSTAVLADMQAAVSTAGEQFAQRTQALLASVEERHAAVEQARTSALALATQQTLRLQDTLAATSREQLHDVAAQFGATTASVAQSLRDAVDTQRDSTRELSESMQVAHTRLVAEFDSRAAALLVDVTQSHATLQTDLAHSDRQRLDAFTGSLESAAAAMRAQSQEAGAMALAQQRDICQTLERTASDIHTLAQTQARLTMEEVARLAGAAAEAPRVAAEMIGALREQLSDSMVRDNATLDERRRSMDALATLMAAVTQATSDQRSAIETLVASSEQMLTHAGGQYGAQVARESARMEAVATQVTVSAVEIASMGEAFSAAVQLFGQSSETLTDQLQRIESALNASTQRSDDQLAYYVAQAREIVDLSISSQKQIVDDLQQLSLRAAPVIGAAG